MITFSFCVPTGFASSEHIREIPVYGRVIESCDKCDSGPLSD